MKRDDVGGTRSNRARRIAAALAAGLVCHTAFVVAVAGMAIGLESGLQSGHGRLPGALAIAGNAVLILQFPLLHSALLSPRGRIWLARLVPGPWGRTLAPTTFVTLAALQLLALFTLWTPSGIVWWQPGGGIGAASYAAFAASWVFLVKALFDAGIGLQSGMIGWLALLRDRAPAYGDLPTDGLFRRCRQPIYFGFLAILWTAPTWTPDHLILALAWTPYCVLAPRLKEQRFQAIYGERFARYRALVPYFLPRFEITSNHAHRRRR